MTRHGVAIWDEPLNLLGSGRLSHMASAEQIRENP